MPILNPSCEFSQPIVPKTAAMRKQKQFQKGLQQLEEEGVMQVFYSPDHVRREPVLAAVGELQFDVVASRLETEYGVKTLVERMPFALARWVSGDPGVIARIYWPQDTRRLVDRDGRMVMLFGSERLLAYCMKEYASLKFQLREEIEKTES